MVAAGGGVDSTAFRVGDLWTAFRGRRGSSEKRGCVRWQPCVFVVSHAGDTRSMRAYGREHAVDPLRL